MAQQQDLEQKQQLIKKVSEYVERYMNNFDGSHDFSHIKRVVGNARKIYSQISNVSGVSDDDDCTASTSSTYANMLSGAAAPVALPVPAATHNQEPNMVQKDAERFPGMTAEEAEKGEKSASMADAVRQRWDKDGLRELIKTKEIQSERKKMQREAAILASSDVNASDKPAPVLNLHIIILSALLHDVGDKKYLKEGEDEKTLVRDLLLSLGASLELAETVQNICLGVSYSSEIQDLGHVQDLVVKYPELAVVQDADRLDAMGAIGIGRVFTYGGAKTDRSMDDSMAMMERKLFKLEGMMKTGPGREMARERTVRLAAFKKMWDEEVMSEQLGEMVLKVEAGGIPESRGISAGLGGN